MKQLGIILLTLAIGSGLGYYFAPGKVVVKTVETVKKDVVTVIKEVKKPDGTTTTETTIKDKTTSEKDSEKTVSRKNLDWMLLGGLKYDSVDHISSPVFYALVQRRIIGEIYAGVGADQTGSLYVGVTIRF